MSTIKSLAVGSGDMFYIRHGSDNFSIIDCCLADESREDIVEEIKRASEDKGIVRFISTHPDEDHLRGLRYLDQRINLRNFYCTKNDVIKEDESEDFKHYCTLRDSEKAFYIRRGRKRKWMNEDSDERGGSGISIVWPVVENENYKDALVLAEKGGSPNNTSAVIKYSLTNGATFLWMGDLETAFMEHIADAISWPKVDVVFAAHHGRSSGRIPHSILDQLEPRMIVLGEAPSRHLHYYGGYNTLTQNTLGDITFECKEGKVHVFVSEEGCEVEFLDDEGVTGGDHYVGTLNLI
uniref:Metallo-beta-lactamase domain-containing protein n=1 Tax=mine drainage metagenome TaxID=410659 RepID=E6Q5S0_9ZZZZ